MATNPMMGGNSYGNTPDQGGNPMAGGEGEQSVKCAHIYLKQDGSFAVSMEQGLPIPQDATPAVDIVDALDVAEGMLAGEEEEAGEMEAMADAMKGYKKNAMQRPKAGKGPFGGYEEE